MATSKDVEFLQFLVNGTEGRRIKWEPTAEDQFTASFKGKYEVIVDRTFDRADVPRFYMALRDTNGREMLKIYDSELANVERLYNLAERASLDVDAAIDEIIGNKAEISDDDIPF